MDIVSEWALGARATTPNGHPPGSTSPDLARKTALVHLLKLEDPPDALRFALEAIDAYIPSEYKE